MRGFDLLCVLVALVAGNGCVNANDKFELRDLFALRLNTKDFEDLERYLQENVQNDYPENNIEAARLVLEKKADSRALGYFRRGSEKAVERFVALKNVLGGKKCDQDAYSALKDTLSSGAPRVVSVAKQIAIQHAVSCLPQYQKVFLEEYDRKRGGKTPAAEYFTNAIDRQISFYSAIQTYVCDPERGNPWKCNRLVAAAIMALISQQEPAMMNYINYVDAGLMKRSAIYYSLEYYVDQYLINPCRDYLHKFASKSLAANIIDPAELDIYEFPKTKVNTEEDRFYRALWTIRFCRSFTYKADARIKNLILSFPNALDTYEKAKAQNKFVELIESIGN